MEEVGIDKECKDANYLLWEKGLLRRFKKKLKEKSTDDGAMSTLRKIISLNEINLDDLLSKNT